MGCGAPIYQSGGGYFGQDFGVKLTVEKGKNRGFFWKGKPLYRILFFPFTPYPAGKSILLPPRRLPRRMRLPGCFCSPSGGKWEGISALGLGKFILKWNYDEIQGGGEKRRSKGNNHRQKKLLVKGFEGLPLLIPLWGEGENQILFCSGKRITSVPFCLPGIMLL